MSDRDAPFAAAALVRERAPGRAPRVGLILGSGLGALADGVEDAVAIPYGELPGFPVSSVVGHAGRFVVGRLEGVEVACMQGRGHFYEGYGMAVMTAAVRTFKLLGCELLVVTNAAGSLRPEVGPGSLVLLEDHINTMPGTPLVGPNDERFGPRFVSLADAYDPQWRARLARVAATEGVPLPTGVFVSYGGPCFETPAEIRMMRLIGGDVVGQSVVPEVIAARHCGLRVLAVSVITNLAEGMSETPLSHEQTLEQAAVGGATLVRLLRALLADLAAEPA